MLSFLPKERMILITIILVMGAVIAFGSVWFNAKYTLMAVEKEKIENVENCIDNNVACSLIYSSTEDIPE